MVDDREPSEKLSDLTTRISAAERSTAEKDYTPQNESKSPISRVGFDVVGAVIGGAVFGWLVDSQFSTKPWGLMTGLILGCLQSMNVIWRALSGPKTPSDKEKG